MDLDVLRHVARLEAYMQPYLDFGRGYACYLETMTTPGRARLPRRLKKATKRYMAIHNLKSMVIEPQNQFVCLNSKNKLIVCHTKY